MSIQRAMHKQAMRDAYPHAYSDDELDAIADKKMQNNEPYEEELLYLRGVGMPRNNRRVEQMLGIGY